jgi:hypothetical protein
MEFFMGFSMGKFHEFTERFSPGMRADFLLQERSRED